MSTTELIELLKSVEFGASGRPRKISISFNSEEMFFPNPKLNIAGAGDRVVTLKLTGEVWVEKDVAEMTQEEIELEDDVVSLDEFIRFLENSGIDTSELIIKKEMTE